MSFPERLKEARQALGLTQEQLGFELDVTKSTVSAWENGREVPSFRLLLDMKQVLGVSLDGLVFGDDGDGSKVADPKAAYGAQVRNETEANLIKAYRRLSPKRQKGLMALLD